MEFDPSRLRRGELIVGASALALLASTFLLNWYGLKASIAPGVARLGVSTSVNGWDALTHVRWLVLVAAGAALALVYFQAARRAPALPVTLSVIVTVLALLTLLALVYRVLINLPGTDNLVERKLGAWIGLGSAAVLFYGGYLSVRQEGVAPQDGPAEIEIVRLKDADGS